MSITQKSIPFHATHARRMWSGMPFCVIWTLLLLLCAGCNHQRPKDVLAKDKMVAMLIDYHMTHQLVQNLPSDKRYQAPLYLKGALAKHNCTEEDFDRSMIWYTRNPSELSDVYTRVNQQLAAREASIPEVQEKTIGYVQAQSWSTVKPFPLGDSVDVWPQLPFTRLTTQRSNRQLQCILTPDSTFQPNDHLEWQFDARFIGKEKGKAVALLMAKYVPDSIIVSSQIITNSGQYTLSMHNRSARTLQQVWTIVHYYPDNDSISSSLFLNNIGIMRYRHGSK